MAKPLANIVVDALAVLRIAKNSQHSTGFLVGIDNLVTGAYPFPASSEGSVDAKSNGAYQDAMLKHLKEVNIDAQCVGWYTTTSMGNFVTQQFIDNQLHYQKSAEDNKIALILDTTRSSNGALNLKAYTLSSAFITAHKEGKFTTESLQKSGLRYQDIIIEHPVSLHNSFLVTSSLHTQLAAQEPKPQTLSTSSQLDIASSQSLLDDSNSPLLNLSIDPYLERSCDLLLESIEAHQAEQNNHQYFQRALAREQAKISAWQAKRKIENTTRAATGLPPLDMAEASRLFKLPQEPSRLESLLVARQVDQYTRQVDSFTATLSSKMFAAREVL